MPQPVPQTGRWHNFIYQPVAQAAAGFAAAACENARYDPLTDPHASPSLSTPAHLSKGRQQTLPMPPFSR